MKRLCLVFLCLLTTLSHAVTLNKLVVFGDSLSDNGNLYNYMNQSMPVSPPYYKGRFSNGLVWIEYLTKNYFPKKSANHLLDYAYGGAAVWTENNAYLLNKKLSQKDIQDSEEDLLLTLDYEVSSYLKKNHNKADPNALYFIWIGANNYLALPEDINNEVNLVNQGIKETIKHLIAKGAKHIVVLNLPDLSKAPAAMEMEAEAELLHAVDQHNYMLANVISQLQEANTEVQLIYVDAHAAVDEMLINPTQVGFNDITHPCYNGSNFQKENKKQLWSYSRINKAKVPSNCEGYLFFDSVHPTKSAHELIADRVGRVLQGQGITLKDE